MPMSVILRTSRRTVWTTCNGGNLAEEHAGVVSEDCCGFAGAVAPSVRRLSAGIITRAFGGFAGPPSCWRTGAVAPDGQYATRAVARSRCAAGCATSREAMARSHLSSLNFRHCAIGLMRDSQWYVLYPLFHFTRVNTLPHFRLHLTRFATTTSRFLTLSRLPSRGRRTSSQISWRCSIPLCATPS